MTFKDVWMLTARRLTAQYLSFTSEKLVPNSSNPKNQCRLFWLVLCINLTQAGVITEKGASLEAMAYRTVKGSLVPGRAQAGNPSNPEEWQGFRLVPGH